MYDHGHAWWRILAWQIQLELLGGTDAGALRAVRAVCGDTPLAWRRLGLVGRSAPASSRHHLVSASVVVALQPYVPIRSYSRHPPWIQVIKTHIVATSLVLRDDRLGRSMLAYGLRARRLAVRRRSSRPTWLGPASRRCDSDSSTIPVQHAQFVSPP